MENNCIECPLRRHGCDSSFPENEYEKHCSSDEHVEIMHQCLDKIKDIHFKALVASVGNECAESEPLSEAVNEFQHIRKLFFDLSERMAPILPSLDDAYSAANTSANPDPIYRSGTSPAEISIQWEDRAPNHGTARELHATEWQLANQLRQILATRSNPCWTNNSPNNHTEDDDVPAAIQENLITPREITPSVLQLPNGQIMLKFSKDDLISNNFSIDSPLFKIYPGGHYLWACIDRSHDDREYLSVHVHVDTHSHGSFKGKVKFLLVDQAENEPWEHEIKSCSGELNCVNNWLGVQNFIKQSIIENNHSRFIRNDAIRLIIVAELTADETLLDQPENVQDALKCLHAAD